MTPPEPHVPIGTQGAQPPRFTTVLMLAAVLASWPQDLEPRLARPNDQQQKIAPLTLPTGQQPPRFSIASRMAQVVGAWPADLEPRLGRPNDFRQKIAPLTLPYGAQPPPIPPLSTVELGQIVATWAQTWDAQSAPRSTAWATPLVPFLAHVPLPAHVWTAWDPPFVSPPRPITVAPLTLPYGTQPQPQSALSVLELAQIVSTWSQPWDAQTAPKGAGWNVPPLVAAFVPSTRLPALIWTAWVEPWVRPQTPVVIAPLTLVYGQAPQPQPPLSTLELAQIVSTWAVSWEAQSAAKNASWNVPPLLTVLPHVQLPGPIWTAWEPPFLSPQRLITIAPLTLVYGNQPAVQPPLTRTAAGIILSAWPVDLEPRLSRPNAERTRIAPLTLTYGQQPPRRAALPLAQLRLISGTWEPPFVSPPPRAVLTTGTPPGQGPIGILRLLGTSVTSTSLIGTLPQAATYAQTVLRGTPWGYWRLDDLAAPTVRDASGSGHDGVYAGPITYGQRGLIVDGNAAIVVDGSALSFGTIFATLDGPSLTDTFSVEFWVEPALLDHPNDNRIVLVVGVAGLRVNTPLVNCTVDFVANIVRVDYAFSSQLTSLTAAAIGQRMHLALVRSPSGHALYVNGVLEASDTIPASNPNDFTQFAGGYVLDRWFVASSLDAGDTPLTGTVDEFAVYQTALSPQQVAAHYANGRGVGAQALTGTAVTSLALTGTRTVTSLSVSGTAVTSLPLIGTVD